MSDSLPARNRSGRGAGLDDRACARESQQAFYRHSHREWPRRPSRFRGCDSAAACSARFRARQPAGRRDQSRLRAARVVRRRSSARLRQETGRDRSRAQHVQTAKGEYYSYNKHVPGRKTIDVLGEALPVAIPRIYFPKTMYWTGKGGPRFIRPIRWIVALLQDEVVPFEIAGVRSGNVTRGHRLLGRTPLR